MTLSWHTQDAQVLCPDLLNRPPTERFPRMWIWICDKHPERCFTHPGLSCKCHCPPPAPCSHPGFVHFLPSIVRGSPVPWKSFNLQCQSSLLGVIVLLPTSPTVFIHLIETVWDWSAFFHFSGCVSFQPNRKLLEGGSNHFPFLRTVSTSSDCLSLPLLPSPFLVSFTAAHSGNLFVGYFSSCLNRNDPLKESSVCVHKMLALALGQPFTLLTLACPGLHGCWLRMCSGSQSSLCFGAFNFSALIAKR